MLTVLVAYQPKVCWRIFSPFTAKKAAIQNCGSLIQPHSLISFQNLIQGREILPREGKHEFHVMEPLSYIVKIDKRRLSIFNDVTKVNCE